jgi:hypothetical protein
MYDVFGALAVDLRENSVTKRTAAAAVAAAAANLDEHAGTALLLDLQQLRLLHHRQKL